MVERGARGARRAGRRCNATQRAAVLYALEQGPFFISFVCLFLLFAHLFLLFAHLHFFFRKTLAPSAAKRGPWSEVDDARLVLSVHAANARAASRAATSTCRGGSSSKAKGWAVVARHVPGRTDRMCRERWTGAHDPRLRHGALAWTREEDQRLLAIVAHEGAARWAQVAHTLHAEDAAAVAAGHPRRSDAHCRNRYTALTEVRAPRKAQAKRGKVKVGPGTAKAKSKAKANTQAKAKSKRTARAGAKANASLSAKASVKRRRSCGTCAECKAEACGKCKACTEPSSKRKCLEKACQHMT